MPKKSAAAEFNMSEAIREILTENPKLSANEVNDAIVAKYPGAQINKASFSVAFYTGRKKLGIGSTRRGRKFGKRIGRPVSKTAGQPKVDLDMLRAAAKFLGDIGGAEAALEAIKQVQAVQIR